MAAEQRLRAGSSQIVLLCCISLCDPATVVVCHLQNGNSKSHRAVETSVTVNRDTGHCKVAESLMNSVWQPWPAAVACGRTGERGCQTHRDLPTP